MQINEYAASQPRIRVQETSATTVGIQFVPDPEKDKPSAGTKPPTSIAAGFGTAMLAPETVGAAIRGGQEVETQEKTTETDKTRTMEDVRNDAFLGMVTNTEYAKERAKGIAGGYDMVVIPNDVWNAAMASGDFDKIKPKYAMDDPSNPTLKVRDERMKYYDNLVKQGLSPLETLIKLYEYNVELPLSYSNHLDFSDSHPKGYWRAQQQDQLDGLNKAIAIADAERA